MRAIFLPVWSSGTLNRVFKVIPGTGPENGWFDRPPLEYPHGLFSYLDWRGHKTRLSFPEGSYIFGDSGGFTLIAKPDEKLDPVAVLQWQAATVNVGAILDRPPRRVKRRDWQECLAFTIRNVERALPYYQRELEQGNGFRWWGVLHGNSEAEAVEWYTALTAVYPFDVAGEGWAVYPGPQAEPKTVARTMRVLQQLGIKRAHFLACTGQDVIATILALGPKAGLEVVTFDSMSHAVAGFNRWWFTTNADFGGRRGRSFGPLSTPRRKIHKAVDYVFENVRCLGKLPERFCEKCTCAVCQYLRATTPERFSNPEQLAQNGWRDSAITLHNVCVQRRCIDRQEEEARLNPEGFLSTALDPLTAARVFRIFEGQEPERPVSTGSNLGLLARR